MSVLEAGGNAVDAAVAMGYALGVLEPFSSGLGGSGGMLVYDSYVDKATYIDYRACAGAKHGDDEVAVPGFVKGMELANKLYGKINISDLIDPAIYYAENGFVVNSTLAGQTRNFTSVTSGHSEYLNANGHTISSGDIMYQAPLAETLKLIKDGGSAVFYNGVLADRIAEETSLTKEDLASYTVRLDDALECDYRGYTVYAANAPMSGLMVLQMLKLSERAGLCDVADGIDVYTDQLNMITEAAQADRFNHTGDPTFTGLDCGWFLTDAYIDSLITQAGTFEDPDKEEKIETTSFTVYDGNRLTVSVTNTLSNVYGSGIYVDGFWLNNSNSNFSDSGINMFGPYKRSRTFTAPVIVTGENGYILSIGTPGGNKIPGLLFRVLENILRYGEDPQTAVNDLRFLCSNGDLYIETTPTASAIDTGLLTKGSVSMASGFMWGSVSIAGRTGDGKAFAAYDSRRGATHAGLSNPVDQN